MSRAPEDTSESASLPPVGSDLQYQLYVPPTSARARGPFLVFSTQEFTTDGGWMDIYANTDDLSSVLIRYLRDYFEIDVTGPPTLEQLISMVFERQSKQNDEGEGIRAGIQVITELRHGTSAPIVWKSPSCDGGHVYKVQTQRPPFSPAPSGR